MQLQGQNSNLKCNISIEYYYNHWNAEKRDVIVSSEMWFWYEKIAFAHVKKCETTQLLDCLFTTENC